MSMSSSSAGENANVLSKNEHESWMQDITESRKCEHFIDSLFTLGEKCPFTEFFLVRMPENTGKISFADLRQNDTNKTKVHQR